MTKLFIDTDILLDLLLKRKDYLSTAELISRILNKKHLGFTTPIVIANIHYKMVHNNPYFELLLSLFFYGNFLTYRI